MSLKWKLGHVDLETWAEEEDPQTDRAGTIREARGPSRCCRESQKKRAKNCPSTTLSTQQVPEMWGTLGKHQRWSGGGVAVSWGVECKVRMWRQWRQSFHEM